MCGIVGIFGHADGQSLMRVAENMVASLVHRGPDDNGVWVDDEAKIAKVKIDLEEFAQLQSGIVEGLEKIEPMITKAESFVEKFKKGSESFKKITNQKN